MKALRWHAPKDIRYEDIPEPVPGPNQLKVKVHYTGICGSDLHEYLAGPILIPTTTHPVTGSKAPMTIGHEFSGKVVEIGEGVTSFKIGDRVAGDCFWTCGTCYYCMRNRPSLCNQLGATGCNAEGSFAEYMVAPVSTFYKLPDSVSDEIGSLVEPLEVAFHGAKRGNIQMGDTIAIVGTGPIGCGLILAAKAAGASAIYVSEPSKGRREMAMNMGATQVIDPTKSDIKTAIWDLTDGLGADITFDCVGSKDSISTAVRLARKAGTTVVIGIYGETSLINSLDMVEAERSLIGSMGYSHEAVFILQLIANGTIDPSPLITGKFALKNAELAFKELIENKDKHLKILLESPNWQ